MNKMSLRFDARSQNEYLARTAISSFVLELNPSVEQLNDVKTAVSEAVTNSVVHAYDSSYKDKEILLEASLEDKVLRINVIDFGRGIDNLDEAVKPYFTTKKEVERSGMGFTIMKMFMDEFSIQTAKGKGTKVTLVKNFAKG
ncbi:MAG: anti-sigma F factor [Christensenellaceae bacterium]